MTPAEQAARNYPAHRPQAARPESAVTAGHLLPRVSGERDETAFRAAVDGAGRVLAGAPRVRPQPVKERSSEKDGESAA